MEASLSARQKVVTRKIGWALFACAFLVGLAVESGELNSWDTANRLQVTRWLWTDAPQVLNPETSWYGVVGRGGEKFAWTGLGQSLWMLPAQIVAATIAPVVPGSEAVTSRFEDAAVTYLTFPLTTALAVVVLYALLLGVGFAVPVAALSALAALWCSSLLPYTNINQENTLILLCTLTAMWAVTRGIATASVWWWLLAGCAAGFNMLIRLTSGIDALAVGILALVMLASHRPGALRETLRDYAPKIAVAILAGLFFVFVERAYNFYRFESWTNTYYDLQKLAVPNYIYEGDFRIGFPGLLWSVKSSVWQFDPLAVVGLVAIVGLWRRMTWPVRALAVATLMLFAGYVGFYATRPFFDGDRAWGARYTTTPMILLTAMAAALVLAFAAETGKRWPLYVLSLFAALALSVQVLSTFFWYNLEEAQQDVGLGWSESMVVLRAQNVAAHFTGNWEEWGLLPKTPSERLRTLNYMPFLAAKYVRPPAINGVYLLWGSLAVLAVLANGFLFRRLLHDYRTSARHV
jgi:hypothetical protein